MKPYSNDLCRRIVEAIQENEETQSDIAGRFAVSISFVEKLWQRFRTTGSYAALPRGGGRQRALADAALLIREAVKEQPDLTLAELCRRVAAASGKESVSTMTMCNELHRRATTAKKKMIHASERDTERVQLKRADYQLEITAQMVGRLKFLDEAGA